MRTFDNSIITHLTSENVRLFFTVKFILNSNYRYTNCDIPLFIDSEEYLSYPFEIGNISMTSGMAVDKVDLEFSNVDLAFSSILLGEDIANKVAIISFIALDSDYQEIATEEIFRGFVSGWELTEGVASISIVNEFMLISCLFSSS